MMGQRPSEVLPVQTRRAGVWTRLRRWVSREDGASAIEYALIAGLIAVSIIGALSVAGANLGDLFDTIATELGNAADGDGGG
jgi:pilus assembly protein Flp/PilA